MFSPTIDHCCHCELCLCVCACVRVIFKYATAVCVSSYVARPSVCELQGEGEVGEDASCPAGDHTLSVPVAGDDKLETAGHGTWSKPHRYEIMTQNNHITVSHAVLPF